MSLKSLKPKDKAGVWENTSTGERINNCIAMLYIHGFMTAGEKNKVRDRFSKWVRMHTLSDDTNRGDVK